MPTGHSESPRQTGPERPGYLFVLPWDVHHAGGVNQVVINLFSEVARDGAFQPLLMVSSWADRRPREEVRDGRTLFHYRLPSPWLPAGPLSSVARFVLELPSRLVRLANLLKKHRVSVVNIHYPSIQMLPFAILKHLRIYRGQLILSLHGMDLRTATTATRPEMLCWGALARACDAIIPCSLALARDARAALPECADRIAAVQNGLDVERLLAERESGYTMEPRLAGGGFLLSIAQFVPKKAHDVLLAAFREVLQRHPDLNLVLIGGSGPTKEVVLARIRELELSSRVFVYENISHSRICEFLNRAMLLALPSSGDEGMPLCILEAGALGVPVVASSVGGIPEVIVDGASGLLMSPGDVAGLAERLLRLIENPGLRAQLAAGLNRRVLDHFTWRRAYNEYRSIIEGRKAGVK